MDGINLNNAIQLNNECNISKTISRELWASSFQWAREMGFKYYRLQCLCNSESDPEHVKLHAQIFNADDDAPAGVDSCACCWAEWVTDAGSANGHQG